MPRRKRSGVIALAGIAALTLVGATACSSGSSTEDEAESGPVTISFTWWGNDERAALTEQAIDLFEEANPDITVKSSFSTIDAYIPKLATQIAGGGAPDLFLIPMESVREYSSKNALTPLTDYIDDGTIRTDDLTDEALQVGTIDDKVMGLTLGLANNAMVYNPTVWAAAGAEAPGAGFTWDDLQAAGEKIRAASDGKTAALSDPGGQIAYFEMYLLQNGKHLFTEEGEVGFTEKDLTAWWTLASELREDGTTTDAETTSTIDQSMQNSGLTRGLSAAEFAAASLTGAYSDTLGAENIAIAPFPTDTDESGMTLNGTNVAAVSSKSKHPEAAAKLLDFIVNDEEAGKILGLSRGIPTNSATYEAISPTLEGGNKTVSDFVSEYQDTFQAPAPLAPAGASTIPADFTLAYEQIIFGQTELKDAAKATVASITSAVS
jgi:multiple sugar transport system substrate-binding protein